MKQTSVIKNCANCLSISGRKKVSVSVHKEEKVREQPLCD